MKYFNKKVFKQVKKNKMQSQEEVFVEFYKVFKILADTFGDIFWGMSLVVEYQIQYCKALVTVCLLKIIRPNFKQKLSKQLKVQSDQLSPSTK